MKVPNKNGDDSSMDDDLGMSPMDGGQDPMGGQDDPMGGGQDPMGGDDFGMSSMDDESDGFGDDDFGSDEEEPKDESTRHIMALLKSLDNQDKIAAERYIQSLAADNGDEDEGGDDFGDFGDEGDDFGGNELGGDDLGMGDEPNGPQNKQQPPQMQEGFVREFNNVAHNSKRLGKRDNKKIGDNVNVTNNPYVSNRR